MGGHAHRQGNVCPRVLHYRLGDMTLWRTGQETLACSITGVSGTGQDLTGKGFRWPFLGVAVGVPFQGTNHASAWKSPAGQSGMPGIDRSFQKGMRVGRAPSLAWARVRTSRGVIRFAHPSGQPAAVTFATLGSYRSLVESEVCIKASDGRLRRPGSRLPGG